VQDGQSRITVVGARKRLDVAVPSAAPIGEYVAGLAELCGQDRRSVLPAAWSLALAGAAPLPVGSSLAEGGVTDGQVLYLRDTTATSGSDPVIEDVDEHVIGEAERQRRSGLPRGVVVMAAGLIWLTGGASLLAARHGHSDVSAAVGLACAALLLLALAWAMEVRKTAVPAPLCLAISMTSIPCLAAAGALLAQAMERPEFFWLGAIAGANAATVLILAATPEAVIFALELQFVAAAVLGPVLVAVRADVVQTATAVTVAALALLATSKSVAATIAVLAKRARRDGFPMSQATTELLIRTRQLLVVVVGGPAFALTIALPALARSGNLFAVALALVASVGLVARARQAVLTYELILIGGSGLVGFFGLLSALVDGAFGSWWATALLIATGVGLASAGAMATALRNDNAPHPSVDAGAPPRRHVLDVVGVMCNVLCAPIALGAFGVLQDLAVMGREMVS